MVQVYINFSCCFLDCNNIDIGDDCLFGPYVQIYPPGHPLDAEVRDGLRGPEFAYPVKIGRGCWIGGHVIIQGQPFMSLVCVRDPAPLQGLHLMSYSPLGRACTSCCCSVEQLG